MMIADLKSSLVTLGTRVRLVSLGADLCVVPTAGHRGGVMNDACVTLRAGEHAW